MSGERRGWPYDPVDGPAAPVPQPPPLAPDPPPEPQPEAASFSRRAVLLLALGGAVALLVTTLALGDWWVRNGELRTLLGRVERAERAQLPALQSIRDPLVLCQQRLAGDDEQICDTVAIRLGAERALPRLVQAGEEVADTRLTSFHGSLRTFRDRYVEHNLAWRTWLEDLARDPTTGDFEPPVAITTTFEEASAAADGALTPVPLHGNDARVEQIFASVR